MWLITIIYLLNLIYKYAIMFKNFSYKEDGEKNIGIFVELISDISIFLVLLFAVLERIGYIVNIPFIVFIACNTLRKWKWR